MGPVEEQSLIVTVTLNAAWDRTYFVDGFAAGRAHRVALVKGCAGGKGINVARTIRALGGCAVATGLVGGTTGRAILGGLAAEGIDHEFASVAAESRNTVTIVDRVSGLVTELREPGDLVSSQEAEAFLSILRRLLWRARMVVLSGSLPPGLPSAYYASLVALAKEFGVKTALDTSGPPLREGLAAAPYLAKPNLEEALEICGCGPGSVVGDKVTVAAGAAVRLAACGTEVVVISLGEHGAVMYWGKRLWHASVSLERVVNAVGSGDALVGGVALALTRGEDPVDALRLGVAAGAANALTETAGMCRREDVSALLGRVEIREVNVPGGG